MGLIERLANLPVIDVLWIATILKIALLFCLCAADFCTSADPVPLSQISENRQNQELFWQHHFQENESRSGVTKQKTRLTFQVI